MFPLRTAFEDRDAVCDAKLDHLVIARLKVQRRMMLERAPITAAQPQSIVNFQ